MHQSSMHDARTQKNTSTPMRNKRTNEYLTFTHTRFPIFLAITGLQSKEKTEPN